MHNTQLINSPLFNGIEKKQIENFLNKFSHKLEIKKNEFLFYQNDIGDNMYLVESGKLNIILQNQNKESGENNIISVIEQGAIIGEMCVFGQKKRSATIQVIEDAVLYSIEGTKFRELIQNHDVCALLICYNISHLLSDRLVKANEFISKLHQKIKQVEVKSELEMYRQRFFDESLFN